MNTENKTYTIEVTEDEAEGIEQAAANHGVSAPDFLSYCVRSICFGINYAINKLSETGHVGNPWDKLD
jgi:hypothetical protein